jgi:hypothetical protein
VKKISNTDLTAIEGEPTARADALIDSGRYLHDTSVKVFGMHWTNRTEGPANSVLGSSGAVLNVAAASALPTLAVGVGFWLAGAPALIVATVLPLIAVIFFVTGCWLTNRHYKSPPRRSRDDSPSGEHND